MTLEEAKTQLSALSAAMTRGAKTVEIGTRRLTFFDLADMQGYADRLRRDIARAEGNPSIVTAAWQGTK